MSEEQGKYDTQSVQEVDEAMEMLGKGYDEPAFEIRLPSKVLREVKGKTYETQDSVWIKLSMAFLETLKFMKGAKLSVWIAIALRIDETGTSHPSIQKIMDDTGLSNREVINTIRELEDLEMLTVRRGEKRYNLYHIEAFAAFGTAVPVVPGTSEESSLVNFSTKPVKSDAKNMLKSSLKQEPINKTKPDLLDAEIHYHLKPKSIKDAFAKYFKLTPNWEAKYNRQFLEWLVEIQATPEQVEQAADLWRQDKRFNWSAPTLKGIQEHWLELVTVTTEPVRPEHKKIEVKEGNYVPNPNPIPFAELVRKTATDLLGSVGIGEPATES